MPVESVESSLVSSLHVFRDEESSASPQPIFALLMAMTVGLALGTCFVAWPVIRPLIACVEPWTVFGLWLAAIVVHGCRSCGTGGPHSESSAWRELVSAFGGAVLFLMPLFAVWEQPLQHGSGVAGLLPWNDAAGYYQGAIELRDGLTMSSWPARRPLNSVLLAIWAALAGGWIGALVLQGGLLALAWRLSDRALVTQGYSLASRLAWLAMIFAFAREFSPWMLSESLGLTWGLLGVTLLVPVFATLNRNAAPRGGCWVIFYALGCGLIALGLSARSGAMFMLPAMVLWPVWKRTMLPVSGWKTGGLAAVAMAFCLTVQPVLNGQYGPGWTIGQGSFAHTWYGLVHGVPDWAFVLGDMPELKQLPDDAAQVDAIYRKANADFLARPWMFLVGYGRGLRTAGWQLVLLGVDCFLTLRPRHLALVVLMAVGLLWMVRARRIRRTAAMSFLLWQLVAMLLSLPFFMSDTGYRGLAGSLPMMAWIVLAPGWIEADFRQQRHSLPAGRPKSQGCEGIRSLRGAASLGYGLAVVALVVPAWLFHPQRLTALSASSGDSPLLISGVTPVRVGSSPSFPGLRVTSQDLARTWPGGLPSVMTQWIAQTGGEWSLEVSPVRKVEAVGKATDQTELVWIFRSGRSSSLHHPDNAGFFDPALRKRVFFWWDEKPSRFSGNGD